MIQATTETTRILLVDDDTELCDLVGQYLEGRGFTVETHGKGETGLERAQSGEYALLILDVMLPDINGFEVLRRLRASEAAKLPVVMLTAHGDEIDRIVGLELGADDYLPKPFNPRELLARIRAVLRRAADPRESGQTSGSADENSTHTVGDVVIDSGTRSVRGGDAQVELTATEFDLLHVLMQAGGRVVARDDLSREALGRRLLPLDRSLDLHMSKLRRKLGPRPDGRERIKTVRGVGYAMVRDEMTRDDAPREGMAREDTAKDGLAKDGT